MAKKKCNKNLTKKTSNENCLAVKNHTKTKN